MRTGLTLAHTLPILLILLAPLCAQAQKSAPAFDAAAAFGARPSAQQLSLSPDGTRVAYIAPRDGQGSMLITTGLAPDAKPRVALTADGRPNRLRSCAWVANDRLICHVHGITPGPVMGLLHWERVVAVDADGRNIRTLSNEEDSHTHSYIALSGDAILDWMPGENGAVLMQRMYVPNDHTGSRLGNRETGLGVDRLDTRTLDVSHVEHPDLSTSFYLTDGFGTVRIKGVQSRSQDMFNGIIHYYYRTQGSREWRPLGNPDSGQSDSFQPRDVDRDQNVAYGFEKLDGRWALYAVKLDDSLHKELVYARPDVDVDSLVHLGRRQHVVGVSYATDSRHVHWLSPDLEQLLESLHKALPGPALEITDASADESRLLIYAGSDTDPGVYYLFDRKARQLQTFLVARDELEGVKLATMQPISYPAGDGVTVPGYLTLPPGRKDASGLPAIVMPHGGPGARDERGFDWLSQFFASQGYAVLQPNFRGSTGYGDSWFLQNGFRSWRVAIGDILAAGHWLAAQGADPARLAVVGWSYGGYAALQSAAVDDSTFKAVVAIAPVTDLVLFKEQMEQFGNRQVGNALGDGAHMHEGSPAEHASQIKVPVLLFHGSRDANVDILQSQRMAERLKSASRRCDLVTWDGLDHSLEDSAARTQLLNRSIAFLRDAFGGSP